MKKKKHLSFWQLWLIKRYHWNKELHILSIGIPVYGLILWATARRFSQEYTWGMAEIIYDQKNMLKTIRQLAVVQFFTWFALFPMFIYSTYSITGFHSGATDNAALDYKTVYNKGTHWAGILMGVYNGFVALIAFLLSVIVRKPGRITLHMIFLFIGGLGFASMYYFKNPGDKRDVAVIFFKKYRHNIEPSLYNIPLVSISQTIPDTWKDSIEVVTILPEPSDLTVNGESKVVGAGFQSIKFTQAPGPAKVMVEREGKNNLEFQAPEWITDKPYRTDRLIYSYSSESENYHRKIFGDCLPLYSVEYNLEMNINRK